MTNLNGQRPIAVEDLGALPVAGEIEHLVGVTRTYITKPSGAASLVLIVESGTFRLRTGHQTGLVVTAPAAFTNETEERRGNENVDCSTVSIQRPSKLDESSSDARSQMGF